MNSAAAQYVVIPLKKEKNITVFQKWKALISERWWQISSFLPPTTYATGYTCLQLSQTRYEVILKTTYQDLPLSSLCFYVCYSPSTLLIVNRHVY